MVLLETNEVITPVWITQFNYITGFVRLSDGCICSVRPSVEFIKDLHSYKDNIDVKGVFETDKNVSIYDVHYEWWVKPSWMK